MSKGFRVMLQIFQVLALLAALLFMTFTFLMTYFDFGATALESQFVGTWAVGFGVLAIAFSPALWSLNRGGATATAAAPAGVYERGPEPPPVAPGPHPGATAAGPGPSAFEPMAADRAPAPPSSSYGQPAGPGFGAQPSAGPASPPRESPWGSGR